MYQLIEAMVDEAGQVFLKEPIQFSGFRRALVIILDDTTVAPLMGPGDFIPHELETPARYRIDRPLGRGGMGETFVGTDSVTGTSVCIKRLRKGLRANLIEQEWRSFSRVESPYVVRYLDRYDCEGSLHLVMEFVAGPTLANRLTARMTPGDCAWLALTLMRGVKAFHDQNVIHCDLKPQNILVQDVTWELPSDATWIPKIIDFGLAVLDRKDADGVETALGRGAGTPAYMAPEQVKGWMLSAACDIYAVGLILWEAICGRPAFSADSYSIMAAKSSQTESLPIERSQTNVPSEIVELVERCTHAHPAHRPTAAEAVAKLEQWVRC